MKNLIILFLTILLTLFNSDTNVVVDKDEALTAFELLNKIRSNPKEFEDIFPFLKHSKVENKKLIWNDTLAKVAEAKAFDMADKNYYSHIDPSGYGINYYINKSGYKLNPNWIEDKKANNFESIAAEVPDGVSAISTFIIDKGVPSKGHRIHLLGLDEWNASLKDIGIGFARRKTGSKYKTYVSLIIAKHDW
ncbi:CAP domain-containing protein [Algibacter luteus]|uniref:CAP domain-containing protein n=1 Tax=Algibacter luteus TaxID=1178825 RepID=UPI002598BF6E|nr:CAP domain-containing protein [Algibacter luteus]WJJ96572.1 CAP domain-containing protein [Algibacter luteus]